MENLRAIVCPKQKLVKIYCGVKRKAVLLKTYRFKQNVPKTKREITVSKTDWSAWSVDDKFWTEQKIVSEYDRDVMNEIAEKSLNFYKTNDLE